MRLTTLCYIEKEEQYLLLNRNKKELDENKGKWIGVGGKFKEGESPEECLLREVREETGLTLTEYQFRGIVTFISDAWGTEYMHLFTASHFTGTLTECDEGELKWIPKEEMDTLPTWEGDRIFLNLIKENAPFFSLTLRYQGDRLAEVKEHIYKP